MKASVSCSWCGVIRGIASVRVRGINVQSVHVVWQWLQPYRGRFSLALVFVVLQAAIAVALPLFFGVGIIDNVLLNMRDPSLLGWVALAAIGVIFVKGVVGYSEGYTMNYIGQRFVTDLRERMYDHLLTLPLDFYSRRQSGELIARLTNDVAAIQQAIALSIGELLHHLLILLGVLAALFWLHWQLALISLVLLPLAAFALNKFGVRIRSFSGRMHEQVGDMAALLGATIGAMRIVKVFTMESFMRGRFRRANEHNFEMSMKSVQAQVTLKPVVELILVSGMVAVLWVGGREVIAGQLSVGALMSFLAYLGMLSQPVSALTHHYGLLQQAAAAGERIGTLLAVEPEPHISEQLQPLPPMTGDIELQSVSFSYEPDTLVLQDIDLTVGAGEAIALVGPSGAGKSTLVNLIPRFYDPAHGTVRLDGRDLRDVDSRSVRRQIGLVPQDPVLFDMTIAENISVGKPAATVEQIEAAARLAYAHDFIKELPNGYATKAGERGANLSGGQRQRIAIARAVLTDPRILILDEATSALDSESESAIHAALQRIKTGRTVILIAHRASTVRLADRIVVLDDGRIVQDGTHDELVRRPGLYKRLYAELLDAGPDIADDSAIEAG